VFPTPVNVDESFRAAGERLGLSARLMTLLAGRSVATATELDAFFATPRDGLHDPRLLPDAAPFIERVRRARAGGERVMLYADFDADGLTGLAILAIAMRRIGVEAQPYVPNRLDEGHGLSSAAVDTAEMADISVIITIDCGTTSAAEIAAAQARGIDVLVTDHHRVPETLPPAHAIVNPHRRDAAYPDRRLAGSGVAFKLAGHLLAELGDGSVGDGTDLADLATIGSVADVAPILGENRAIARLGLDRIRTAPRPGIAALLERAHVDPARADLDTIAFALAPRLNAAGRVGEALDAARLLLADDPDEARSLAESLETSNRTRRDLTKASVEEARALVDGTAEANAVVIVGDWPVGIVGLVASRLAEDLDRPAVVGTRLGSVVRASCRSDGTTDLAATLAACADLFTRYGGHAGAAGFELPADRWNAFATRFELLVAAREATDRRRVARIDLALPGLDIDYALHRELERLAPWGPGNPAPMIAALGMTATRVRAANGGHAQITLRRAVDVIDGIAFDRGDLVDTVREGERIDVVGQIASRRFGGLETLQIEIVDVAPSGVHEEAAAILDRAARAVAVGAPA
jgi:single-stranded-DNA-specific exonuclease